MRCFHWLCFSDWLPHLGCFFDNVSAVWSSGLLQVYLELGNSGISNPTQHMAEATKALNQKLEVPQGAEFNPECSGSDKTMAVTASIEAAAAATALSSSSSNGLNGIRTWYPRNNKGLGSKFQSSRVRDKPEEGRRVRRPKRCGKNNLDEEVSPKSIINNHC